jgi:hypothetical protein
MGAGGWPARGSPPAGEMQAIRRIPSCGASRRMMDGSIPEDRHGRLLAVTLARDARHEDKIERIQEVPLFGEV